MADISSDAPFVGECEEAGSDVRAELRLVAVHGVKRRNEGGVAEGARDGGGAGDCKGARAHINPAETAGDVRLESPQPSERGLDNRVEHVAVEIRIGGEKPAGGLAHPEVSEDLGTEITPPETGELYTSGQAAVDSIGIQQRVRHRQLVRAA